MNNIVVCPGCGLKLSNHHIAPLGNYNATGECYEKYSELSNYTVSKQDLDFIHQHVIDTYSAQHSGNGMKPITTAFSLIGLYFAIENGFNGKQVQRVHMLLGRQKYNWILLPPPDKSVYLLNVSDVLNAPAGKSRDIMIQNWMRDVWESWEHQHNWIKDVCNTLLN